MARIHMLLAIVLLFATIDPAESFLGDAIDWLKNTVVVVLEKPKVTVEDTVEKLKNEGIRIASDIPGFFKKVRLTGHYFIDLFDGETRSNIKEMAELVRLFFNLEADIVQGKYAGLEEQIVEKLRKFLQQKDLVAEDVIKFVEDLKKQRNNGPKRLGTEGRHHFGSGSVGIPMYQVFALEQSEDGTLSARAVDNDVADAIVAKFAGENVYEGDEFRPRWNRNGEIVDSY